MNKITKKSTKLNGEIIIPSDKSISHRAILFSLLTKGKVKISNFSVGKDCQTSLEIVKQLGAKIEQIGHQEIVVTAPKRLDIPKMPLFCGNSGTTTRLISGILAGQDFKSELYGDESLSKRPMKRIILPLSQMQAKIEHDNFLLPLKFFPSDLCGIDYKSPLASAQVKSCVLLAGLFADGETSFEEPYLSRNHTELMLKYLGAEITVNQTRTFIKKSQLYPRDIIVPGDISSAAFFIAAALLVPNSDIIIKNVGINPTRTGILDILKRMGGNIEVFNERVMNNELVADLHIKYSELTATTVEGEIIPRLIDEIPILVLVATQAKGTTVIKNAGDLKNKETDRLSVTADTLNLLGANVKVTEDGFIIDGRTELVGVESSISCCKDHRIAMMLYVAGLICKTQFLITDFEWVNISFPEFEDLFEQIL